MNEYKVGSIWRKWDLHVHTKGTKKNDQFVSTDFDSFCNTFFRKAIENEIKVIGVTDYFSIDNFKKVKLFLGNLDRNTFFTVDDKKKIEAIYILPNVELRMMPSTDKGRLVNIHCLFNPEYINSIDNDFFGSIEYSGGSGKKFKMNQHGMIELGKFLDPNLNDNEAYLKGINSFIVSHSNLQELIDSNSQFKENTIIVVSNSNKDGASAFNKHFDLFENESASSLDAVRKSIYSISQCIFSGNENDREYFLGKKSDSKETVIQKCGSIKPCLHGSDAHSEGKLFKPDYDRYCWIKADPTFEGLKQILIEPEDRVFIGEIPPKTKHDNENPKFIIDKLNISDTGKSGAWFDGIEIEFNSGLVAIIGNKGSGKSALTDILALTGNSYNTQYSFLNKDKFLSPLLINNKNFKANLKFKDGYPSDPILLIYNQPNRNKEEKIVYLSQTFVNDLCDKVDSSRLQTEINRVVFSHISDDKRYNFKNYENLTDYLSRTSNLAIESLQKQIFEINKKNIEFEIKLKPDYQLKFENEKNELERQIFEFEKQKPAEVKTLETEQSKLHLEKYKELNNQFAELLEEAKLIQSKLNQLNIEDKEIELIGSDLDRKQQEINFLIQKIKTNSYIHSKLINISDIISFDYKKDKLIEIRRGVQREISVLQEQKLHNKTKYTEIDGEIKKLNQSFNEEQQSYQKYLHQLKDWDTKKNSLELELNQKKQELENIINIYPQTLQTLETERIEIAKSIIEGFLNKQKSLSSLYSESERIAKEKLAKYTNETTDLVQFESAVYFKENFNDTFFNYIAKNIGSFYGTSEGEGELNKIKEENPPKDMDFFKFTERILQRLKFNSNNSNKPIEIEAQLRKGIGLLDFYNFLFGFSYLDTKIKIKYEKKDINQLSPGQKGILLLVFYLLIDKDKRPIIIDQPEENLDNETIYKGLVPIIREVKKERQIIIVTHNPNLAIVCDAEQIIYASIEKSTNKISYTCGSIENDDIRRKALDILEGTKPAFNNRKTKYGA